jgi:hypothetical protein
VEWSFTAKRGARNLRIIDVAYNNLPLGVLKSTDPQGIRLKGKVLSSEIRHGLIRVTAFDEEACKNGYERMKKIIEQDIKQTGNTKIAIPVYPCDLKRSNDYAAASSEMSYGYFAWRLQDSSENFKPDDYRTFAIENLLRIGQSLPSDLVSVPENEAPHTVDVVLGPCAAHTRKICGQDSSCLWGITSCISKESTGRSESSSSPGSEADVVIVPSGGQPR